MYVWFTKSNIPFQLYFQPPITKPNKTEKKHRALKMLHSAWEENNIKTACCLYLDMVKRVQGHTEVIRLHGGVEGHTLYMHVSLSHSTPQWGKARGAVLAASVNTPWPLLSDCEGYCTSIVTLELQASCYTVSGCILSIHLYLSSTM